ncbi:MAG: tRNA-dihydrouridine synthase family protein, partial [Spirochaetales bacterium]|nr:tRNA-dihydrouridine synthase family protein [Spirochaetales bacterium]
LAPMVELSHRPLRELVSSFGGCDRYYTEMTSASGYLAHSPFDRWFMDSEPAPGLTVIQLFDSESEPLAKAAARLVEERAAAGVAIGGIDINFGCSAPHIEKAGGGVSWMKNPPRAADLIAAVVAAAPGVPVSAKLRLGYEPSAEALVSFCGGLQEAGAAYLVIHPRLHNQKFRRQGRWDIVGSVASALDIPVVGNGDIRSYEQYRKAIESYGVAGVMLGREAVRRPWVFALIRGKENDSAFEMDISVEETGLQMLRAIRARLPAPFHVSRARRFFFYYCDNLSFGHHLRYAIQNANSLDDIEAMFRNYFVEVPGERLRHET